MGIEKAAQNIENEAMKNPSEAAASIRLLGELEQCKLLNQIQKDAALQDASFSVEHDKKGTVSAIHFTPLFSDSGKLLGRDKTTH